SFFNEDCLMGRITLIIHVQRPAAKRYRSVIHNCAQFRSDFLSYQTGESRRFLPIEISLQTMADGFVKENARPARPEHHFHRSSRRIDGSQLENCLSRAFARNRFRVEIPSKNIESLTAAAPLVPKLTPAPLFSDAHHIQPHQWLKIPCSVAVRSDDENVFRFVDIARLNLFNARVEDASRPIGFLQERYFLGNPQFCGEYVNGVQIPFLVQRRRNSYFSA